MENLVQAVTQKLKTLPKSSSKMSADVETLSHEEKEALRDAERLAEMYKEIKPEPYIISGGHLFTLPQEDFSN